MTTHTNLEADLRAIETINKQDVQFALANDSARMMRSGRMTSSC